MITADNSALVIIDIQGKLSTLMYDKETFFTQTKILIQAINQLEIPVIWAEQVPEKLGATEQSIAQLLTAYQPIIKTSFSCCGNQAFIETVNTLDKQYLLVTGIETHICVFQTVSDLLNLDKQVHVISDATSSRSATNKQVGLNRMQSQGAIISSVEMCLFELLKSVNTNHFRAISQLLK